MQIHRITVNLGGEHVGAWAPHAQQTLFGRKEYVLDVTFYNVTITVTADDGPRAYAALCAALGTIDCEWITRTFTITADDGAVSEPKETNVLWPPIA